jgi:large subunit ribosomal protein L11
MAKKVVAEVKLQLPGGQATPNPPVGPSLAPYISDIPGFIREFNAQTQDNMGVVVSTVVTCYADRTYSFEVKSPPTAILLKQEAKIAKGSGEPNKEKVATISQDQLREIAKTKLPDLNTDSIESAMRMVAGTARSMGIIVEKG